MFRAASHQDGRQRYNIEPMVSHSSVQFALMHRYARDPEYVKAVIRSYIEVKKARGRQVHDICMKLNYIEQELPQFAESFHAVRAEYRLPPSRVLVPPRPLSETRHSSLYSGVGSRMAQSSPSIARRSTETRRPSSASVATAQRPLPAEFQVRPDANAEEEAAPPPYARQDPEPDSTRILQERLAAEASNLPPDTPPSSRPRLPSSTTSPPTLVWATPTGSPANPQHIRRASQPARPVSPPHPPEDDEIARAYEENQMEEAKRASIIAERERQEVEEAMRLSLADAEGENAEAGPSRPAHSLIDMDEGGQQRPASISATLSQPEASLSNRNISSGTSANPDKHLGRAMQHLSIPGGPSLLDSDDEDGAQQLPPMVPQKTGAVIQSRNPFLSASEDHVIQDPPTTKDPAIPPKEIIPAQPTANSTTGRALPRIPRDRTSDSQALSANENASLPVKQEQELLTSHASYLDVSEHPVSADPLHTLSYYQIIFLIDDSASIAGPRWDEAKRAFSQVAETAMKYSTEGIDVYFTNSKRVGRELRTSEDVEELLSGLLARGTGLIGHRLKIILRDYMERLSFPDQQSPGRPNRREVKPLNLIIITDGECAQQVIHRRARDNEQRGSSAQLDESSEDDLENVIVACARQLDRDSQPHSQIGIQFLQIGNDHEAREALQELDDGLSGLHSIRDMVDLVIHDGAEMTTERINKTLFGGIDRSWDDYIA